MNRADRHRQSEETAGGSGQLLGEPPALPGPEDRADTAGKREVDLYVRTYNTLLQSSGAISVSSFEPAHFTAASSLHAGALEREPDLNAFIYSTQRLPSCMVHVTSIVLGQSARGLAKGGYRHLHQWEIVSAPGRRRRWLYDRKEVLVAYVASASDLDDLVPTIVAYQIEWNKMHRLLNENRVLSKLARNATDSDPLDEARLETIRQQLLIELGDWDRLLSIWGASTSSTIALIATNRKRFTIQMVAGSYLGYARATRHWWSPASQLLHQVELTERPVYFISSNTHSIVNVLSGTARRRRDALIQHVRDAGPPEVREELVRLEAGESRSSWDNLLYFMARSWFSGRENDRAERTTEEQAIGIHHLDPAGAVDVGIQIIELAKLDPAHFDPRLSDPDGDLRHLRDSDAIVVNVNYPLGLAAYNIMTQVGMSIDQLRGVYILGKAATLNGRIGDVMLSNVVYDEHSGNTYWFENCFTYSSLAPFLVYGAALDNQKAVTVKGTYLQNQGYLDFYYRENFTVVEMEAGPYLNAVYEDLFLRRYPAGEAINLHTNRPGMIDLGIIHYASDTPYTRAQTLGARGLSYYGMDSTYASTIAILRRVFEQAAVTNERERGVTV